MIDVDLYVFKNVITILTIAFFQYCKGMYFLKYLQIILLSN